ncbi:MAG TPA: hypothetical protein VMT11_12225 [Myxococcaceae bacterium]|nr:hypothetical protein [Myxococcaceae bacterium]
MRGGSVSVLILAGALSAAGDARSGELSAPKVPFGNHPCQSLSPQDQAKLGFPPGMTTQAFRAPAGLLFDNVCSYFHGGTLYAQIGYQAKIDYDTNSTGNRSKSHQAPADLPGGFYDGQGGLWFAKSGYYVVVSGKGAFREPVARLLAGKL